MHCSLLGTLREVKNTKAELIGDIMLHITVPGALILYKKTG